MKKSIYVVLSLIFTFYCVALLGCNTAQNKDYKTFTKELNEKGGFRALYTMKNMGDKDINDSQFKNVKDLLEKILVDAGYKNTYISLDQSKYIVVEMAWDESYKNMDPDHILSDIANIKLQDNELEIYKVKALSPTKN